MCAILHFIFIKPDFTVSAQLLQKMSPGKTVSGKREWMCFHCKEANVSNMKSTVFSTVDEVYDHWKLNHSDGGGKQQPFRFYLVHLLHCNVDSCRYYSRLHGLYTHHMKNHSQDLFVPILNGRCAMCLDDGDALKGHYCNSLQKGIQLKLYNPVLLTDQDLAEIQAIGCNLEYNRQRIKCQYCGSIFTTMQNMNQHHFEQHGYIFIHLFGCHELNSTFS